MRAMLDQCVERLEYLYWTGRRKNHEEIVRLAKEIVQAERETGIKADVDERIDVYRLSGEKP